MPNILLSRIDNRLVHGQVGTVWTRFLGANLIVVADDDVVTDEIQKALMSITATTSGADIRFFSIEKTIEIINRASDNQKIFLVVKTPKQMVQLIKGNVPIKEVNIGNMHSSEGKKQIAPSVYVDDEDEACIQYMIGKGIEVYVQTTPTTRKIKL